MKHAGLEQALVGWGGHEKPANILYSFILPSLPCFWSKQVYVRISSELKNRQRTYSLTTEEYKSGHTRSNCSRNLYRNRRRTVTPEVRLDSPRLWPDSSLALAGGQQERQRLQAAEVAGTARPHGEGLRKSTLRFP